MNEKLENVKILDCSIRDGGHLNKWNFDKEFVKNYYNAVNNSGVDYIELGYRTTPGLMNDCGLWRFTPDELIREIVENPKAKIAIMADVGKIKNNDFSKKEDSLVDLVRVAFYKNQIDEALDLAKDLVMKGYEIGFNLMAISEYSKEELESAMKKVKGSNIDVVYIADSFGSLYPEEVKELIIFLKENSGKKVGFHPHNNLQLAFANSLAAIEAGAEYIDATVNGMGRGAGNLPLELFLLHLNKFGGNYNVNSILEFIEKDVEKIREDITWGYQSPYLITGTQAIHPTYAKGLKDKGYSSKDIASILEKVKARGATGYIKNVLDLAIEGFKRSQTEKKEVEKKNITENIIALVPCRAGSVRVKDKNVRGFAGDNSLIKIKLRQLVKVPEISKIVVSTDDQRVIEIAKEFQNDKIIINQMDKHYTQNLKSNDELVSYIINMLDSLNLKGHLLWTHVTSPFITEETYSKAIREYLESDKHDSLISVKKIKGYVWDKHGKPLSYDEEKDGRWPKTQDIDPVYFINSGIFIAPIELMKITNDRVGNKPLLFECDDIENLDVDWLEDFHLAEVLWKALRTSRNLD